MFERLDHTAVAVADLDEAINFYTATLGFTLEHREAIPDSGVEAAQVSIGDSCVELLMASGPDTTVGRFLGRHGPGLHHVAYRVGDIDAVLAQLEAAGLELIDTTPRRGIRGSRVAFLHPASTGGVLTEIVEPSQNLG